MHEPLTHGGVIRKLWVGEADLYRDHLLRLDPESRRNRFAGAVSDGFIRDYCAAGKLADAVIHGFFIDATLRGAAGLRPLATEGEAEAAFSIERDWQSHGIGKALLERTVLAARNRRFKLLHMSCLADNRRMQQLALKLDAELTFEFGSVAGNIEAPYPTPMSAMRELVADSTGLAAALLHAADRAIGSGAQKT
jgi:GNAT superfamily N-acetyltransferase